MSAHASSLKAAPSLPKIPSSSSGPAPSMVAARAGEDQDALDVGTEVIDMEIFSQLLEMDDDDTHEFSRPLAVEYIEQGAKAVKDIEILLDDELSGSQSIDVRLKTLSELGHFLKGSSASLGLLKVTKTCEAVQNVGKPREGTTKFRDQDEKEAALRRLRHLTLKLSDRQAEATRELRTLCSI
ncbi:uncharacterized protein L969DRAFT_92139 [Mixia osmundae IAM 14324]|uniref:HPt domain-containing protein n=1 Tax=Mixia osmundae (strain CBS 9802 / IAM 14324 / JCM 22182 / KY 12970) TaxID=764103 RepID=G7E7D4_MIXOS|nr:uncharacterized protein L969DRAFT_92139 [Mixia osmundae IAM 14324]KEI42711.1 hypothetical protein L969DRAFT_92139 [Mixia osmundae IAM 14324]GAA98744.1 hypothetical protein E5Q_05432 [Mixia osmundae IAM 14324]